MDNVVNYILIALMVLPSVAAFVIEHINAHALTERRHRHHDTYVFSSRLLHRLMLIQVWMTLIGFIMFEMASEYLPVEKSRIILIFFVSFSFVLFVVWHLMRRYSITAYEHYMVVTPLLGKPVRVEYDQITAMRHVKRILSILQPDIDVFVGDKRVTTLLGFIDLNRVLLTGNRYDVRDFEI